MNELIDQSARKGTAVTPSDTVNLTPIGRALYVGVTGNISLETVDGSVLSFVGIPAGAILPVQTLRVNSTGTTATNIIALHD